MPILINQQLAVGPNRFLFTLYDAVDQTKIVAAPDVTTNLAFYDLARDPAAVVATRRRGPSSGRPRRPIHAACTTPR